MRHNVMILKSATNSDAAIHAVTATKVDTCQRTCNLAVLVAE